jgi:hypothetical protein
MSSNISVIHRNINAIIKYSLTACPENSMQDKMGP